MNTAEREFLRTLARAEPDWSLLDIPHLEEFPAVRWKLQNLQQLALSNTKKFDQMVSAFDDRLQQLRERDRSDPPRSTAVRHESSARAGVARRALDGSRKRADRREP